MPTALPLAFRDADVVVQRDDRIGITDNRDLLVVAVCTAIGLAVTIGLAVFLPTAAESVALALIVS